MRPPSDIPQIPRPPSRRRRWIIAALIVLIILFASLRTFAVFYTDALWFSSVNLHSVWLKLFEIKVGLMVTFAVIFAVMLLASLMVAERLAPKGPSLDAEDEFVKRYQEVIGPYARWLRVGVVVGPLPHRRIPGHRPVEQLDPVPQQHAVRRHGSRSSTATSPTS